MSFMSHDVAHCCNAQCDRKETCERWILHLDARKKGLIVSYICPKDPCEHYVEYKEREPVNYADFLLKVWGKEN